MQIVLIIIVLLIIALIVIYNGLVQSRNKVKNAWSQIDIQLQRRFDLIPNLVESIKGYMEHEESTLSKIAELRGAWSGATTISEKAKLDVELSSSIKNIMAVAESYPDLKSSANFIQLQEELSNTENKISHARQAYNEITTAYNTKLETIPSNIIGKLFNFEKEDLFTVESDEIRKNVKVDFSK